MSTLGSFVAAQIPKKKYIKLQEQEPLQRAVMAIIISAATLDYQLRVIINAAGNN